MTGNRLLITTAAITCLGAGAALGALLLWPAEPMAMAGQVCGLGTFMTTGALCRDTAPPPQLLVDAGRDEDETPAAAALAEAPPPPVMATPVVAVPAEPPPPSRDTASLPTEPAPAAAPSAAPAIRPGFLVVVGSYAQREQAEDRRRTLGWSNLDITEATVQGRPHYRVTIRSTTREQAVRALNAARAAGIGDAWIAPAPGNASSAPDTAIAARAV
ncbi:hypothetical protein M2352_001955 [Azospirillum fermentarium]|uniref:SPOR domain-containing protein n=1 Tax=Azospirillum fermentarium TaxID=1233114 RepID=UPI002226B3B1|nr:SPOR domain-containing protein [Azospirillum fermentarium]MCW2246364.1 hypothetical protein [Azospirillum fermentarium]